MLKIAYQIGFEKALKEEGLTKEAFGGLRKALSAGLSSAKASPAIAKAMQSPMAEKTMQWGAQHPLLARMGIGAGVGGVGGGLFGDEGGFARGALMGAGAGAGAYGGRAAARRGASAITSGKRIMDPRAASALGAAGAGAAGYGLAGGLVPGRE